MRTSRGRLVWLAALCASAAALAAAYAGPGAGSALVVAHAGGPPDLIVSLASHEWERLPRAAEIARDHPASTVILTVPEIVSEMNCHLCGQRVDMLAELGVRRDRIAVLSQRVRNTYDEAAAVRGAARTRGAHRVAIVTSPYHTRRAFAAFRAAFRDSGIAVDVYPALASSPAVPERWWASPYDRSYVVYEWAANLYYRVRFGIPLREL